MQENKHEIDFVIIWVDGGDLEWQKEKNKFSPDEKKFNINNVRYRDWGTLQYWFRGVEKYAPWVRNIYFVTCGHVPSWLNLDHPKLHFIKHSDYISGEYLPTFSSHTIELNLHRIEGLADRFVYFNDDTFLTAPVTEEDFFIGGLPRNIAVLNPPTANRCGIATIVMNNLGIIADHFSFMESLRTHWRKWFHPVYGTKLMRTLLLLPWRRYLGFYDAHLPAPFLKSTFEEVWEKEEALLKKVSSHRFRDDSDVNQYLMTYWQIATGRFAPGDPGIGKMYDVGTQIDTITDVIRNQKRKMICVNDSEQVADFSELQDQLMKAFDSILGEKSSFEK